MRDLAEQAVACWRGEPVTGPWRVAVRARGGNGVVLRADRNGREPLAVKLSPVDERARGHREHAALTALAGSGVAPAPVDLVVEPTGAPVTALVTSWVEGTPSPQTWPAAVEIAGLLARLHRVRHTGERPAFPAPDAVALLRRGRSRLSELPPDIAAALRAQVDRLVAQAPPSVQDSLVHVDANPYNVLVSASGPVLVDWEYSGHGDRALDFAYLCAHPRMLDVCADDPGRCRELAERLDDNALLDRAAFALAAVVLYWTILHEILVRAPVKRLAGARQRDPATLRRQLVRYRAWFQRLDDR